jgi:hypothetical protein
MFSLSNYFFPILEFDFFKNKYFYLLHFKHINTKYLLAIVNFLHFNRRSEKETGMNVTHIYQKTTLGETLIDSLKDMKDEIGEDWSAKILAEFDKVKFLFFLEYRLFSKCLISLNINLKSKQI